MSNNRGPASPGDVLHFVTFLGGALVLWYFALTMHWPWLWELGAALVWTILLVATLDWVRLIVPALTLLVVHVGWFASYSIYLLNAANNVPQTNEVVVCKLFTTDDTTSGSTETRISTNHGDFTLGALKFTSATGKVTYFTSGANAATAFKIGGSYTIMHKGGHLDASDVVKNATELTRSVGACKK